MKTIKIEFTANPIISNVLMFMLLFNKTETVKAKFIQNGNLLICNNTKQVQKIIQQMNHIIISVK